MQILNIAGYKFTTLTGLTDLRAEFLPICEQLALKGTILLSTEGINISLSGAVANIGLFKAFLRKKPFFSDITFRESDSTFQPFNDLKIKIKSEIITMRCPDVKATECSAPTISPRALKAWLDEKRDITLLDTRNEFEVRFGTFQGAVSLQIDDFSSFPAKAITLPRDKPIVMFCTGGIRCEKAGLYLLKAGFKEVYQLLGGILNYFAEVGDAYYEGDCFVFDQRVALNPSLAISSVEQCKTCEGPIPVSAPKCVGCN